MILAIWAIGELEFGCTLMLHWNAARMPNSVMILAIRCNAAHLIKVHDTDTAYEAISASRITMLAMYLYHV